MKTLLRAHTACALGAMPPAPMRGRGMYLQASGEPAGLCGGQGLRERGHLRRSERIAPQGHHGGLGRTVIKPLRALRRPVHCRPLSGDVDRPPPRPGLGQHQHGGCPAPFVCVLVPRWRARLGGPGRARFLEEWHRLCVPMNQRVPWILGALRESHALLHGGHQVRMVR